MMLASVTIAAMLSAQTAKVDSEALVVEQRFEKAGWKTRRFETSLHVLLAVSTGKRTQYVFRFERFGQELRGFPTHDPNRTPEHYVGGDDPTVAFFELLDWEEAAPVVKESGFSMSQWESHARSVTKYTHKPFESASPTLRRMTTQEGADFLKALRAEEIVQRLITDEDGERVENLPFDARIRRGYILGDVVWAELESKRDPLLVKYAVMVKCTPKGFRVVFSHANDVYGTPYDPAFLELTKIGAANKDLYAWWNYYAFEKEDFGASGKWFRTQLTKSSAFEAWSPHEMESTLRALKAKGPSFRGLVYARKSGRAVVQFYNADDELRFAEFLNGELLRTRSLEEAVKHVESTNSSDVWWCYNGVSQQFGHPTLISVLYQHRMKSGG